MEVTIEKVVFGGDGLARSVDGPVLFIPFTAEGERVRVRVTERKKQHARAEIAEILAPSVDRETAPCPYYRHCGGCQYQHLTYEAEGRLKEAQVREAFSRLAKMENAPVRPIIPSPSPYSYRNRITVHAAEGKIGFRSVGGRELVDIRRCLLAREPVNDELTRLRASRPPDGHYSLRDATVPPSGFFQANHDLQGTLRGLVGEAMPERGKLLLEGYCGGGFFTQGLAGRFERVLAVDNDPRTLRDAHRLKLANVVWQEGDAVAIVPGQLPAGPDAVLLDPPREGLLPPLSAALAAHPVPRLVYVSCDPATLARDTRVLSRAYRLLSVQPIDLFPRTAQIECVTVWDRL